MPFNFFSFIQTIFFIFHSISLYLSLIFTFPISFRFSCLNLKWNEIKHMFGFSKVPSRAQRIEFKRSIAVKMSSILGWKACCVSHCCALIIQSLFLLHPFLPQRLICFNCCCDYRSHSHSFGSNKVIIVMIIILSSSSSAAAELENARSNGTTAQRPSSR